MKKNRQSNLVLCGLERLKEVDDQAQWTIFGDYMSKYPEQVSRKRVSTFPYDQESLEVIQGRQDITAQDRQVIKLYNKLLASLTKVLNEVHKENMSIRQWELVIGYWLRHFLDAIMVRWVLVESALEREFDQYFLLDDDFKTPLAITRNDFATLCNDSRLWNQRMLSDIAKQLMPEEKLAKVKFVSGHSLLCDAVKRKKNNQNAASFGAKHFLKKVLKKIVSFSGTFYSGRGLMVIYSPILSVTEMLRLAFKLRKIPIIYFLNDYEGCDGRDTVLDRTELSKINNFSDKFSHFVASAVAEQLPQCYFEQWSALKKQTNQLNLPAYTDMVYVGSGIITDECLRLYVARQVGLGSQFVISQHGGVYGVSLIQEKTEFVEQRVSDKWISWGWSSEEHKNVIPGPNLKPPPKSALSKRWAPIKRDSLLVALPPIRFSPSRLNYSDPNEIVDTHIDFLKSLSPSIGDRTIIRPAPNHRAFKYVSDFGKHFELSMNGSFWQDADRSRLFLCTHNATTLLEALSSNFPTVILLPKYRFYTQHYLRSDAQPWFDKLRKVNMYFEDENSARRHIEAIWPDVSAWWNRDELQTARKEFCDNFCQNKTNNLQALAEAIAVEKPEPTKVFAGQQGRRVAAK